jgi:hypothetical protein
VIYSCAEVESNWGGFGYYRTRFALDDRLTNEFWESAGMECDASTAVSRAGMLARPFPFRVVTHSDIGAGPDRTYPASGPGLTQTPYWNSCQGKDGCTDCGNRARAMDEAEMIRWLLADSADSEEA